MNDMVKVIEANDIYPVADEEVLDWSRSVKQQRYESLNSPTMRSMILRS